MRPNNLIDFVIQFEGFSAKPYLCPAGIPTIGYGSTYYIDGRKVTLQDSLISENEARKMLETVLHQCLIDILELLQVTLKNYQTDALTSLVYNIGINAFKSCTLLRFLNVDQINAAAEHFLDWVYITQDGAKVKCDGLIRRRTAERELFLRGY